MDRFIDTGYRLALNRKTTNFLGRVSLGELPTPRLLGAAGSTMAQVGKGTLGLLEASGWIVQAYDPARPDQRLKQREHTISVQHRFIMSGPPGIDFGEYMFEPWAVAAWGTDLLRCPSQPLKPPMELAEDYYIMMGQRGVSDGFVRETVVERIIDKLPKNVLDMDDIETLKLVDLHSMTRDLSSGDAG